MDRLQGDLLRGYILPALTFRPGRGQVWCWQTADSLLALAGSAGSLAVVVQHPMEQHRNAQQLRASDEKVLKDVALLRNTVSEVVRTTQARLEGKQREAVAILNALPDVRGALFPAPAEALEVDSHAVDQGAVGETSLPPTAAPLDTSHVPGSALAHTLLQPLAAPILNSWPLSTTHSTPPSQPIHQNAVASSSSISLPPLQQAAHTPVFRFTAQPPNACSEKVSLANDAYDKTDRHIRTLDTELDTHTLAGRYVPDFLQQAEELDENDDGSLLEVQAAPRNRKTRHRAHKGKGKAADDANDDFMHLKGVERVKAMMAGQSFSKCVPSHSFSTTADNPMLASVY
jgi:hypothetical protein